MPRESVCTRSCSGNQCAHASAQGTNVHVLVPRDSMLMCQCLALFLPEPPAQGMVPPTVGGPPTSVNAVRTRTWSKTCLTGILYCQIDDKSNDHLQALVVSLGHRKRPDACLRTSADSWAKMKALGETRATLTGTISR